MILILREEYTFVGNYDLFFLWLRNIARFKIGRHVHETVQQ